jgi:hypothetical protein
VLVAARASARRSPSADSPRNDHHDYRDNPQAGIIEKPEGKKIRHPHRVAPEKSNLRMPPASQNSVNGQIFVQFYPTQSPATRFDADFRQVFFLRVF